VKITKKECFFHVFAMLLVVFTQIFENFFFFDFFFIEIFTKVRYVVYNNVLKMFAKNGSKEAYTTFFIK